MLVSTRAQRLCHIVTNSTTNNPMECHAVRRFKCRL